MAEKIDLNQSVYDLTEEYPERIDIMADPGFPEIRNRDMRSLAGKHMTLPQGAQRKHIPMQDVLQALAADGFVLEGEKPQTGTKKKEEAAPAESDPGTELLKSYLARLADGEDLESVRKDFVRNFRDVDPAQIMKAEQELMKEGTPITRVTKLCDLHSALFHGATKEEKIANAERAVEASLAKKKETASASSNVRKDPIPPQVYSDKLARTAALSAIQGHPLYTFARENEALEALMETYRSTKDEAVFQKIREISIHYAKKGDLLYPHLKAKYHITGPADVMWTVDDEIRDELGALSGEDRSRDDWNQRMDAVLTRAKEMIYKEKNILFPICAVNFSEEEWYGIYNDSKDYDVCFGVEHELWEEAEKAERKETKTGLEPDLMIEMPGGRMTVRQLTALLNTIPLEISFIDADNINCYFNEGHKLFKRPHMAIGREVFSCHPPKIEPMVRAILDEFRSGTKDQVPVWLVKNGREVLVTYMAVRDADHHYLGALEVVQDMEAAKEHFKKAGGCASLS